MCTAGWIEVELPAVKEDRDAVLREVAVAPGVSFRELDGRIGRFGHRIGDAVLGIGEQSGQMAFQGLGGVDDRGQARVRGPEVPAVEELSVFLRQISMNSSASSGRCSC